MIKEAYKSLELDITRFDIEDVITTSGIGPGEDENPPDFDTGIYELPNGL